MRGNRKVSAVLPDFCAGGRVVQVLLLGEAVAMVLALGGHEAGDFWRKLFLLSVYVQWIGVASAAVLCLLRRHAGMLPARVVMLLAYVALLAVTLVVTCVVVFAGRFAGFGELVAYGENWTLVARNVAICGVVAALGLRYFWLRAVWVSKVESEARARLDALQARIEPHFLFNTLNSISSLITLCPYQAEAALGDLSGLLRARLRDREPAAVTLDEEMGVIEAYLRIEKLRFDTRLDVECQISDQARQCCLPSLALQPLVENAVGHGIARLPEGGTVRVRGWVEKKMLIVEVCNSAADEKKCLPGNCQALSNIRRRLDLVYGRHARLDVRRDEFWYVARLSLPETARSSLDECSYR